MTVATEAKDHTNFPKCQYCGKEASATQRIRACTRCYAVGYCSKDCQRQDWPGKVGHKKKCRPRPMRPTNNDNDATDIIAPDAIDATPTRPAPNNEVVRLEVKRGGGSGNDEVWEDAGPINMLGKTMTMDSASASISVNANQQTGNQPASLFANKNTNTNTNTNTNANSLPKPKQSLKKELPTTTQQILGPSSNKKYNYRHSSDGIDTNLLIFLHGAGDTHVPFDTLGLTMKLPQTATLSLSASIGLTTTTLNNHNDSSTTTTKGSSSSSNNGGSTTPSSTTSSSSFVSLPFGLGSTWFEEMDYQVTGEILPKDHPRRVSSLSRAVTMLDLILCSLTTATGHCNNDDDAVTEETTTTSERTTAMMGWIPERIFLFGFSAGACLAMEVCRMRMMMMNHHNHADAGRRMSPLGGAICIAGGIRTKDELPDSMVHQRKCPDSTTTTTRQRQQQQNQATDVLLIVGSKDAQYPKEAATLSKQFYHHHPSKVTIYIQNGKGHAMIGSKEEMQVVMEFLSKRLVKRMISMEGLARNDF